MPGEIGCLGLVEEAAQIALKTVKQLLDEHFKMRGKGSWLTKSWLFFGVWLILYSITEFGRVN